MSHIALCRLRHIHDRVSIYLGHDLLFDPGLQFRPTFSRRKRDIADNYWAAVLHELESGCTCTTFDLRGKPTERRCVCGSRQACSCRCK